MKVSVVGVGRIKENHLRLACEDYLGRIARYCKVSEIEVKDGSDLRKGLAPDTTCVALEVRGASYTSQQFSKKLQHWGRQGKGNIAFLIGGATGIPPEISRSCQETLSLSTMTLPHRLARIFLLEQIYRGFSLLRGEPYAREDEATR